MKLLSITWNYENDSNFKSSLLYKSFVKQNDEKNFINIHFNRNDYKDLESEFEKRFGYQYEFILYKIYLLEGQLEKLNDQVIIYADTNDVVCLTRIEDIEYDGGIIFSSEKNRYPNETTNWKPQTNYPQWNLDNNIYLNSGLIITTKNLFIELLRRVKEDILKLNYTNFGGDQGVYTYYYINNLLPQIILDHNTTYFLSTYLSSPSWFEKTEGRIKNKMTNTFPHFVHDNGWNYGSPKIIENFNLI